MPPKLLFEFIFAALRDLKFCQSCAAVAFSSLLPIETVAHKCVTRVCEKSPIWSDHHPCRLEADSRLFVPISSAAYSTSTSILLRDTQATKSAADKKPSRPSRSQCSGCFTTTRNSLQTVMRVWFNCSTSLFSSLIGSVSERQMRLACVDGFGARSRAPRISVCVCRVESKPRWLVQFAT